MADLNRMLSDNLAVVVVVLAVALLLLLAAVVIQSLRLARAVRGYRALVQDGSAGSLADVLEGQAARAETVARGLEDLASLHGELATRTNASLQHVGLVRFNPFDDTGSDQSFAIALLDGRRNGLVISSLHGRTGTRIFAKPVEAGASTHTLSDEERQAIGIAVGEGSPGQS